MACPPVFAHVELGRVTAALHDLRDSIEEAADAAVGGGRLPTCNMWIIIRWEHRSLGGAVPVRNRWYRYCENPDGHRDGDKTAVELCAGHARSDASIYIWVRLAAEVGVWNRRF